MQGQIRRAINNLHTVYAEDRNIYSCKIKGKKLPLEEFEYNPLAVGDRVDFTPYSENEGLITARLERKSVFRRWNVKLEKNQTIAANMDQVAIVTSAFEPPFRPRFLCASLVFAINSNPLVSLSRR